MKPVHNGANQGCYYSTGDPAITGKFIDKKHPDIRKENFPCQDNTAKNPVSHF